MPGGWANRLAHPTIFYRVSCVVTCPPMYGVRSHRASIVHSPHGEWRLCIRSQRAPVGAGHDRGGQHVRLIEPRFEHHDASAGDHRMRSRVRRVHRAPSRTPLPPHRRYGYINMPGHVLIRDPDMGCDCLQLDWAGS